MSTDLTINCPFGELSVVVLMPGTSAQQGIRFRPNASQEGIGDIPRRDLAVIRAMLQDAIDDVDDECRRKAQSAYERAPGYPVQVPFPRYPG